MILRLKRRQRTFPIFLVVIYTKHSDRFSDGRKFGKKWKRKNEKTMVGFGRTELSLSLSCTEFRALSHGHGFRGPCFNGVRKSWVFHDFLDSFLTVFMKRLIEHFQISVFRAENDTK